MLTPTAVTASPTAVRAVVSLPVEGRTREIVVVAGAVVVVGFAVVVVTTAVVVVTTTVVVVRRTVVVVSHSTPGGVVPYSALVGAARRADRAVATGAACR